MSKTRTRKPCVAVVEDEPDFRALLCRWLAPRYRTLAFDNAEDFLESEGDVAEADVVISDVRMDGMNGFRLCERIRAHPRHAHRPVILLTGIPQREGLFAGQSAGASAYLVKPVERDSLLEQLEKLLDPLAF